LKKIQSGLASLCDERGDHFEHFFFKYNFCARKIPNHAKIAQNQAKRGLPLKTLTGICRSVVPKKNLTNIWTILTLLTKKNVVY
jgi:hypothetical protein